ncbi:hypothetical protein ACIP24_39945 [Streptomyces bobili]|uniref:hypothetical protein n=1 Tax=Streptomyces bobili TaxID=67280 RepID=UPI0038249080
MRQLGPLFGVSSATVCRVPCDPAAGTTARARAGFPLRRRPGPYVDRGRHPRPAP